MKQLRILVFLCAVIGGGVAAQTPTATTTNSMRAYVACIRSKVTHFIGTGEPAETIATAAISSCEPSLSTAVDEIVEHSRTDPRFEQHNRQFGFPETEIRDDAFKNTRARARGYAIQYALELKSQPVVKSNAPNQ